MQGSRVALNRHAVAGLNSFHVLALARKRGVDPDPRGVLSHFGVCALSVIAAKNPVTVRSSMKSGEILIGPRRNPAKRGVLCESHWFEDHCPVKKQESSSDLHQHRE